MSFDPNARLDPGQISDRRGMGGRTGAAIRGGGLMVGYQGGDPNDCDTFSGDL